MAQELRKSGIDVLGDIPWGTHFCHFYQTKKDFVELLTAYFKAGLETNEYCLWASSNPLNVERVVQSLRESVDDFDGHLRRKSFEILPITEVYLKEGIFNPNEIIKGLVHRLENALDKGFEGMRIHANKGWLEDEDWEMFQEYEKKLTSEVGNHRMIILCTYPLAKADASTFLDVVHVHGRVVASRQGELDLLQEPGIGQIEGDLRKKNVELASRVEEGTDELKKIIQKLETEIAERKKVEAQLKLEKELSIEILDSIPGFVGLFDENMRFVWWNKVFEMASGYTPDEIRLLHGVESFYDNDHDKRVTTGILKEMFEQGFGSAEVSPLMKDGRARTLFFNGLKIVYEGKPCLLCIGVDISERKEAELHLIKEKELSNEIIDSIPGVFMVLDENFRIVRWNKNVEVAAGATAKKIPSLHAIDDFFSDANDRQTLRNLLGEAFEKGYVHAVASPHTKDSGVTHLFFSAKLIDYEGRRCIICTVTDISDRKKVEEKLRESESLLAEAEHLAHVGSWSLDLRTQMVTWSKELYVIFGIKPSEFDHTLEEVIGFSHPDDREFIKNVVADAVKTQKPYSFYYRMIRPDGDERILHVSGTVMTDEQKNPIRMYGAVQDVTERRKAEETLHQSYKQVRALTNHLQNIREEERIHMAREIHDELGQKLTVMKMDVSWLHKKVNGSNVIVRQKLQDLNELLDATLESVRKISTELRPSLLDDLGLAAAMEWHLKEFEKRSGIKTYFNQPDVELQFDDASKIAIFRIFQESLTNVARHSKANDVKIEMRRTNDQVSLRIQDNGNGFDIQKALEGKTLGILGMKERAESLGWRFEINTYPESGTTVAVSIPFTAN